MHDDEYGRLKRLIVRSWFLMLLILTGLAFWGTYELKNLNRSLDIANSKLTATIRVVESNRPKDGKDGATVIGPVGEQGAQGQAGTNGSNGANGQNGSGVTPQQIAAAVSDYLSQNPIVGTQGPQGDNGNTLQLRVNPDNCVLQGKYDSSDSWFQIAQLVQPCVVSPL